MVLCDFHREKAWRQWTSKGTNEVLDKREEVLSGMRRIAKAPTLEEMEEAITDLQANKLWVENARLKSWFGSKWLPAKKVNPPNFHCCLLKLNDRITLCGEFAPKLKSSVCTAAPFPQKKSGVAVHRLCTSRGMITKNNRNRLSKRRKTYLLGQNY